MPNRGWRNCHSDQLSSSLCWMHLLSGGGCACFEPIPTSFKHMAATLFMANRRGSNLALQWQNIGSPSSVYSCPQTAMSLGCIFSSTFVVSGTSQHPQSHFVQNKLCKSPVLDPAGNYLTNSKLLRATSMQLQKNGHECQYIFVNCRLSPCV